jgi:hypothetical protein
VNTTLQQMYINIGCIFNVCIAWLLAHGTTRYYEVLRNITRYYAILRNNTPYYAILRGTTGYYKVVLLQVLIFCYVVPLECECSTRVLEYRWVVIWKKKCIIFCGRSRTRTTKIAQNPPVVKPTEYTWTYVTLMQCKMWCKIRL